MRNNPFICNETAQLRFMTSDASSGQANSFKDQLKADLTASSPGNAKTATNRGRTKSVSKGVDVKTALSRQHKIHPARNRVSVSSQEQRQLEQHKTRADVCYNFQCGGFFFLHKFVQTHYEALQAFSLLGILA